MELVNDKSLYDEDIVNINFNSEVEFDEWKKNVVDKQGIWSVKKNYEKVNQEREELLAKGRFLKNSSTVCCERYGSPRKPKANESRDEPEDSIIKKKRKRSPSKKVKCKAHYCKRTFTNGEVEVNYHWQHVNHDPFEDLEQKGSKSNKLKKATPESDILMQRKEVDNIMDTFKETLLEKLDTYKDDVNKLKQLVDILKDTVNSIESMTTSTNSA